MHHRWHHNLVALGEEAGRDDPDDEVLGGGGAGDADAGPGVFGDRAGGEPPRRERVGIRDGDAPASLRVGDQVADPVDRVAARTGLALRTVGVVRKADRANMILINCVI